MQNEEAIRVFIRVKPSFSEERSVISCTQNTVTLNHSQQMFQFNEVFDDTINNNQVFTSTILPIIPSIFEGYNSCILAYGQTSSGKTFTMKGQNEKPGLIPLTIKQIFKKIEQDQLVAQVSISYFQIYNQNIVDLLEDGEKMLKVAQKGKLIVGLTEQQVLDEMHSVRLFDEGQKRRTYADNKINVSSSRSHTVFRIKLQIVKDYEVNFSTISLVDLAGSECIQKTKAEGKLKKQGQNINKSLLTLSKVLIAMSQKSQFIPYRDSQLTQVLQPCLGNTSKSIMICTIQQNEECLSQTANTIRFGTTAASITMLIRKNVSKMIDGNAKNGDFLVLLADQRKERQLAEQQASNYKIENQKLKEQNQRYKKQINQLKKSLILEESIKNHKELMVQQLEVFKTEKEKEKDLFFNNSMNNLAIQQKQNSRLKSVIVQMKDEQKRSKQTLDRMTRNQRTLLDKITKYQKQLVQIQNTIKQETASIIDVQKRNSTTKKTQLQQLKQSKKSNNKLQGSRKNYNTTINFRQLIQNRNQKATNNIYTLGMVNQINLSLLDLRIQMKRYVESIVQYQTQNDQLSEQLIRLKNQNLELKASLDNQRKNGNTQVLSSHNSSQRQSLNIKINGGKSKASKYTDLQINNFIMQIKNLQNRNNTLLKKNRYLLQTLKKNAKQDLAQMQGFNQYVSKHFKNKQTQLFEMLTGESANQYMPPVNGEQH